MEKQLNGRHKTSLMQFLNQANGTTPLQSQTSILAESTQSNSADSSSQQRLDKNFQSKHVCQQITPGVIYEWKGSLGPGQFWKNGVEDRGKGILVVREGKEIIFEAKVDEWSNGLPTGFIEIRKISKFELVPGIISCQKQEYIYSGNLKDGMKDGFGVLKLSTLYSNNEERVLEMEGLWRQDQFLQGRVKDEDCERQVDWEMERKQERIRNGSSFLKIQKNQQQNRPCLSPLKKKHEKTKKVKKGMRISCTITQLQSQVIVASQKNQEFDDYANKIQPR